MKLFGIEIKRTEGSAKPPSKPILDKLGTAIKSAGESILTREDRTELAKQTKDALKASKTAENVTKAIESAKHSVAVAVIKLAEKASNLSGLSIDIKREGKSPKVAITSQFDRVPLGEKEKTPSSNGAKLCEFCDGQMPCETHPNASGKDETGQIIK